MEQSSLSKVQYPKYKGHNKSEVKLKRQLDVEVEVQETLGLVALQLCHFKQASHITFSHHAAIRHLNSEPKSGD
jgi:hypothetical protein